MFRLRTFGNWLVCKEGGNLEGVSQDNKVPEISGHGMIDASELLWEHVSRQDVSLPIQRNMEVLQNAINLVFNLAPHDAGPDGLVLVVVHVQADGLDSQGHSLEQVVCHRDVLGISQVGSGDHVLIPHSLHGPVIVAVGPPQLIPSEDVLFRIDLPSQL